MAISVIRHPSRQSGHFIGADRRLVQPRHRHVELRVSLSSVQRSDHHIPRHASRQSVGNGTAVDAGHVDLVPMEETPSVLLSRHTSGH